MGAANVLYTMDKVNETNLKTNPKTPYLFRVVILMCFEISTM